MQAPSHTRGQTTLLVVVALVGVGLGVGMFTFSYGKGASYLTNDPAACANCHIMEPQYSAWLTGSHRKAATCNDCHTPDGTVAKYVTKATNGFWHSTAFTSGIFHEPIQIKPRNRAIAEQRCRDCHAPMVHAILANNDGSVSCLSCHQSVGHRR